MRRPGRELLGSREFAGRGGTVADHRSDGDVAIALLRQARWVRDTRFPRRIMGGDIRGALAARLQTATQSPGAVEVHVLRVRVGGRHAGGGGVPCSSGQHCDVQREGMPGQVILQIRTCAGGRARHGGGDQGGTGAVLLTLRGPEGASDSERGMGFTDASCAGGTGGDAY